MLVVCESDEANGVQFEMRSGQIRPNEKWDRYWNWSLSLSCCVLYAALHPLGDGGAS